MEPCSIPSPYTLKDLLEFCWTHKGKKGFHDFTYVQAAATIVRAAADNQLIHVIDNRGICGICIFSEYPQRIYVHHIFGLRAGFASLIAECFRRYPKHDILGQRRGDKVVTFNTKHLWAIIHRQSAIKQNRSSAL